jgi:hypothetical protein
MGEVGQPNVSVVTESLYTGTLERVERTHENGPGDRGDRGHLVGNRAPLTLEPKLHFVSHRANILRAANAGIAFLANLATGARVLWRHSAFGPGPPRRRRGARFRGELPDASEVADAVRRPLSDHRGRGCGAAEIVRLQCAGVAPATWNRGCFHGGAVTSDRSLASLASPGGAGVRGSRGRALATRPSEHSSRGTPACSSSWGSRSAAVSCSSPNELATKSRCTPGPAWRPGCARVLHSPFVRRRLH